MPKRLGGTCGIPSYDDRTYVGVLAMTFADGTVMPRRIVWHDGRHWDVRASSVFGRWGRADFGNEVVAFEVDLGRHAPERRTLWLEGGRWFVEGRMGPVRPSHVDVIGPGTELADWMTARE